MGVTYVAYQEDEDECEECQEGNHYKCVRGDSEDKDLCNCQVCWEDK